MTIISKQVQQQEDWLFLYNDSLFLSPGPIPWETRWNDFQHADFKSLFTFSQAKSAVSSTLASKKEAGRDFFFIFDFICVLDFLCAVAQEVERVISLLKSWPFDPRLLQSACRSGLKQVTEPKLLPKAVPSVYECVCVCERALD